MILKISKKAWRIITFTSEGLHCEGDKTHMIRIYFDNKEDANEAILNGISILGRCYRVEPLQGLYQISHHICGSSLDERIKAEDAENTSSPKPMPTPDRRIRPIHHDPATSRRSPDGEDWGLRQEACEEDVRHSQKQKLHHQSYWRLHSWRFPKEENAKNITANINS